MTALTYVYPYGTIWPDDDVAADVAARGCRSVTELYSEALANLRPANPVSELRLFFRHGPDLTDVRTAVQVDPVREGFETAHLAVPRAFAERAPDVRARMLLEAVHGVVARLGGARGGDPDLFEECRRHVLDHDLEYRSTSQPKVSPDRRREARAVSSGRRRTGTGGSRSRSPTVASAPSSPRPAKRSRSARRPGSGERLDRCAGVARRRCPWCRTTTCRTTSCRRSAAGCSACGAPARLDGGLRGVHQRSSCPLRGSGAAGPGSARRGTRLDCTGTTAPHPVRRRRPDPEPSDRAVPRRVHRGDEAVLLAGGPGLVERFGDPGPGVQIAYEADRSQVRSRRSEQTLRNFVDRADSSLPSGDPASAARAAVEEIVALARRRTGFGPHPAY